MGRILIGGLVGGVVVFVWGFVAHTMLPLGEMAMTTLSASESADVARILEAELPGTGMYLLPSTTVQDPESAEYASFVESYTAGPTAFVALRTDGEKPMGVKQLGSEFASNVLGALLAALVLTQVRSGYVMRVLVVVLMALFGWVSIGVSQWAWYRFTTDYTAIALIEEVAGWFLAGLLLAAFVRPAKD